MSRDTATYFCQYFKYKYLLKLVPLALFRRRILRLYYLRPNRASERVARKRNYVFNVLLRKLSIERYPINITEIKNSNNRPMMDVAYIDSMDRIMDKLDGHIDANGSLLHGLSPKMSAVKDDLRLWVKQHIAWPTFDVLLLVEVAAWAAFDPKSKLCGEKIGVVIDRKNYGTDLIMEYAREKDISILSFYSQRRLKEYGVIVFLYQLLQVIVKSGSPIRSFRARRAKKAKGGICTFHDAFDNFCEFYTKRNYNLFWYPESGIAPDQISIFSRKSRDMGEAEINRIRNAGFGLSSCDGLLRKQNGFMPHHRCSWRAWRLFFTYVLESIRLLLKVKNRTSYELWKMLSLLMFTLPYWEDFFAQKNAKVLFKPGVSFSDMDLAAKLAGAATVSFQYTNHFASDMGHHDSCDVYFVWGETYERAYKHRHAAVRNIIQSGYVFDYTFGPLREKAAVLRKELMDKGADFILSVFDESLKVQNYMFIDGYVLNMLLVYKALFEYAVFNPAVAIIIKPKKKYNRSILQSSAHTAELVRRLEKEGRVKFLESEKFPVEAGMASDLSIGMSSNSSAALESLFAGVPAIFYDSVGTGPSHPDYVFGKNKIIFDNTEIMIKAIDQYRKTRDLSRGFADWSTLVEGKDPFRDGKASQRIGLYIETLLTGMEGGLTKERAIMQANKVYTDKFGADKVTTTAADYQDSRADEKQEVSLDYEQVS